MTSFPDTDQPVSTCTVVVRDGHQERARFAVPAGAKVLHQMIRCNVRAVPVGCRGGGCGVCRVRVLAGEYDALRMSRVHVSEDDAAAGVVLACRIVPRTDLVLTCAPRPAGARPDQALAHPPSTDSPTTTTELQEH